jgi:hypothetical protein
MNGRDKPGDDEPHCGSIMTSNAQARLIVIGFCLNPM